MWWLVSIMVGLVGFFTIALIWALGADSDFRDRCEDLGGVPVMTRGDDTCLDPDAVLDYRDE